MSMASHEVSAVGQEDGETLGRLCQRWTASVTDHHQIAMPSTTETATVDEFLYRFPPFPTAPVGVAIVPFSAFVPAGYRRVTDPSGGEVDAWVGIPTVKLLSDEETAQRRKAKKRRRNAGNAMDAEGRLIPWWEEWEEGEPLRAVSEPSFDRCGFVWSVSSGLTRWTVG
jgi:hypothetical protein